jgi:2-polyprenyl-3-methyl-5-hydroxy-6-metoxy-1,4-benzoquinol methylase
VGIGCAAVEALVSALHAGSTQPKTCRSCGHHDLDAVLDLGRLPLANALLTVEQLALPEDRFPLELYFCPRCALVQIGESLPPERLFSDYAYASSYSDTMVEHARVLVEALVDARRLGRESLVIEVASNDGYLLQSYRRHGIPVLGIEPAANIAELATRKGIPTLVEFFDEELARRLAAAGRFADVIHAHNVLAHVPDPNRFVAGIKQVLKGDGIAIVEAPYVRDLIAKVEFDTIYHEHFSYYSASAVAALAARHGLVIRDVELTPIHGGSLRLTLAHAAAEPSAQVVEQVVEFLAQERSEGLLAFPYYRDFAARVAGLKEQLLVLLWRLKGEGKRIAAYGASAKGSTLMNAFGIDDRLIDFVVDRSDLKQGRFTPGNHLPILPPSALIERAPDYVLLLTWNFAAEILTQQTEFRRRGAKFIIPVPEVSVV